MPGVGKSGGLLVMIASLDFNETSLKFRIGHDRGNPHDNAKESISVKHQRPLSDEKEHSIKHVIINW